MVATYDAVGPAGGAGTAWTTGNGTWTHVNGGNSIFVWVTVFGTDTTTGCTYGGVTIPKLKFQVSATGSNGGIAFFGLTGATVPTGSNTVTVTTSDTGNHNAGSTSVAGAGSLGTVVGAASSAVGTTLTVTVTNTTTGGLIVCGGCIGSSGTWAATSPNVLRWSRNTSNGSSADNAAGSTDPSTGGGASQAVTLTSTVADDWGIVAVEVLPAGPPPDLTDISWTPQRKGTRQAGPLRRRRQVAWPVGALPPPPAVAVYAIAAVANAGGPATIGVTTATAAGDSIVVNTNNNTVATGVSDTQGNTYQLGYSDSGNGVATWAATYKGSPGTPTAALGTGDHLTVTGTFTGGTTIVTGVHGAAPQALDAHPASANGTSAAPSGPATGTLSAAGDIIIASYNGNAGLVLTSWGAGFTRVANVTANAGSDVGYFINTGSTASVTPSGTCASQQWVGEVTALVAAGSGPVTQPGAASLSGTGTMSFGEVDQQATVPLSGTGTMTAGPPSTGIPGAASLSGTGTMTNAEVQAPTVALSGTGSMSQAEVQVPSAALSGAGTMTAGPPSVTAPAPYLIAGNNQAGGASSYVIPVTGASTAGDGVVVAAGVGGASPPAATAVTDTKGNTYTLQHSTPNSPSLAVFTSPGTFALTATDTLTVTLSGTAPTGGVAVIAAGLPGTATVDLSTAIATATSTAPAATGTPSLAGEVAIGAFSWANAGGAGTVSSPFTQLNQQHAGTSCYVTLSYYVNPPQSSQTAGYTITSAAWRASLLSFSGQLPGTATLSGTGTMTVAEVQQVTTTLSGTGTMTLAEVQAPAVSLSGTGIITAGPPAVSVSGAASLSGTGTMSLAEVQAPTVALSGAGTLSTVTGFAGSASLSGAGTLATGVTQRPAAALSGTGTMVLAATQQPALALSGTGVMTQAEVQQATVALSGTGTMTQAETQLASVALSGTGSVIVNVGGNVSGSASLSGTGSMTLTQAQVPAVALSGTGTMTQAEVQAPTVTLSGTGAFTAAVSWPAGASLSGAGSLTTAISQGPGVSLSGSGSLTANVGGSVPGAASLSGTGSLTVAEVQGPSVALAGTGTLGTAVITGPGAALSGTGALTTSVGGVQPATASLSGTGTLSAAETTGAGAALSGTGSLTTATGSSQPGAASLSGSGSLSTAYLIAPAVAAAGSGTLTTATQVFVPGTASLSGSGTLSAAQTVTLRPTVALSGTGTMTAFTGGVPVFDTDAVHIEDSEFAVITDPDATTGTDAGELIHIKDTDSVKITEAETSAWPHDTDSLKVTDDGGWSGPVADLTPETLHITEGGERIRVSDTESAAAADAHVVQVWTYQPPFRWTGSEYALHYGDRVAWTGPRLDRAAFELADRLAQASTVEFIHDTDQVSITDAERFGLLNVQLTVRPSLEVTLTIDA